MQKKKSIFVQYIYYFFLPRQIVVWETSRLSQHARCAKHSATPSNQQATQAKKYIEVYFNSSKVLISAFFSFFRRSTNKATSCLVGDLK